MLKFSLLLLLLLTPHGAAARQGRTTERPSRVAGTRVSLVPPAGFVPARRFPGYALEAEGASIMVTELPAPLDKVLPGFSDPEQLKARALTLLSKESVARAAKDAATGRPLVIYQAILFDGRDYYLMQGLVSRERAPRHLPSFKEMAKSFRRR